MKVYYTYSLKLPEEAILKVKQIIEDFGGKVQSRKRPSDYSSFDPKEAENVYHNNLKLIKSSDIVIADISYTSSGVGYEVSLALSEKKPVVCIYNLREYENKSSLLSSVPVNLKGNTSKYLILKEYSLSTLKKTLELAIKDAKDLADTKFILIIPPEIDKYLEWNVKEKGIAKAEITRNAVEDLMKRDKEYAQYLKETSSSE